VYLPALQNGFVVSWDDGGYVYENSFIRSFDTQLLKWAFLEFHAGHWHPLTWLSHAIDYALWGLNPLGHHLTNNLLHTLNTFLVVLLIMRLLEEYQKAAVPTGTSQPLLSDRTMKITAATTGLLFGLHPLHVESVAWVSERKDLLCAFFSLLTLITYTYYAGELRTNVSIHARFRYFNKKYLSLLALFILALLSKPMAVTLPFVLLILDWYVFRRIKSLKTFITSSFEKLPFFALALISSIAAILALKASGTTEHWNTIPLLVRMMIAFKSLIVYLGKMIVPFHLVPLYILRHPEKVYSVLIEYIVPFIMVTAITGTCIAVIRKHKLWLSIWSYYVITLMPVLGIFQVGVVAMADRYTYLPSLGPFIIIGLLSAKIYEKVSSLNRWRMMPSTASIVIAISVFAFLSYATILQVGIWENSIVFWNYVIDKEPSFLNAYIKLGEAYTDEKLFDKSIEQIRIALDLRPDYAVAYNTLGLAYLSKGQPDMAIEQFRAALRLKPNYADAHFNLGNSYLRKGSKIMAQEEFESGLAIEPNEDRARQVLNSIDSM